MIKLLTVLIFLLASVSAEATTRYIDGNLGANCTGNYSIANRNCTGSDGNAYTTANAGTATAATVAGDILYVRSGTYNLRFASSLMTINSGTSNSNRVKIAGYPNETVTLAPSTQTAVGVLSVTNLQYVWFDNFIADGTNVTGSESTATTNQGSSFIRFSYIESKNNSPTGTDPAFSGAGFLIGGTGHELQHVYSHDNGLNGAACGTAAPYGIYLSADNSTVEYSRFIHNGTYGIHQYHSGSSTANNNIIRFNEIGGNGAARSCGHGLLMSSGSGNKAYGNIIRDQQNGGAGVSLDHFQPCINCEFYNNTVVRSTYGLYIEVNSTGAQVKNNIFMSNGTNVVNLPGGSTTFATNLCFGSGGTTGCSITGSDPLFTDATNNIFTLQSGSPAINAGTTLSSPYNVDINGVTRPVGAAFDIGAYEGTSATRYVSTTGATTNCITMQNVNTPGSSIAAGIACSSSSDTLYIRTGTYNERFSAPANVTIAGYPGELPLIKPTTGSTSIINLTSVAGATLRNLEISGQGLTLADACVGSSAPTNGLFEDLKIHDCVRGPGGGDTTGVGMLLGGTGNVVRRLESYNNNSSDSSAAGDNGGYGIYFSGSGGTVEYSYFHDNGGTGAQVYPAGGNTVRFNRIANNGFGARKSLAGLSIASTSVAYGNVIYDNKFSGIDGLSCSGCAVYNNTVVRNGISTGAFGVQLLSGSSMTIRNNIFRDNPGGNIVDWVGGITADHNLCYGTGGTTNCSGGTNINADPLFTDYANNIFTLQAGSPAINAGVTLAAPYNVDIVNTSRPQPPGSLFDLGAYEYGGGVTPSCPGVAPALVASYAFEDSGNDSTGNNHPVAFDVGWSYTAGKYGRGVVSTGAGGITVANHADFYMCGGFTYEGWINIPNVSGDYAFIVKNPNSKNFLFAALTSSCGAGRPSGGYSQTSTVEACYGTSLSTAAFNHLAVTYDSSLTSANVKLYLNGGLVTSADGTTLLDATTGTLQFCTSSFNETCPSGTIIDEVLIYNYPRTAAQIVNDMNTAIQVGSPTELKISGGTRRIGPGVTLRYGLKK